ncbi:hypothetical protein J3E74DRAFT_416640 [Bipolaris maydis]|nr:hypothetical protein J3E74DRAFT_416640 [Bipolaris maydis]
MKLLLLISLGLLPTLAVAGEKLPPRPSGKYGKNVPPEPVDQPLKHPKDPALWWQGITDDDVYYPEWAIAARADATAETKGDDDATADSSLDSNTQGKKKHDKKPTPDDANLNPDEQNPNPDDQQPDPDEQQPKPGEDEESGFAGTWKKKDGRMQHVHRGGKKERWGRIKARHVQHMMLQG